MTNTTNNRSTPTDGVEQIPIENADPLDEWVSMRRNTYLGDEERYCLGEDEAENWLVIFRRRREDDPWSVKVYPPEYDPTELHRPTHDWEADTLDRAKDQFNTAIGAGRQGEPEPDQ